MKIIKVNMLLKKEKKKLFRRISDLEKSINLNFLNKY
jgi:hypothetical protein